MPYLLHVFETFRFLEVGDNNCFFMCIFFSEFYFSRHVLNGYISYWVASLFENLYKQVGTPICIPSRDFIDIGRIASIENNHKPVDYAKKGQRVAIKV